MARKKRTVPVAAATAYTQQQQQYLAMLAGRLHRGAYAGGAFGAGYGAAAAAVAMGHGANAFGAARPPASFAKATAKTHATPPNHQTALAKAAVSASPFERTPVTPFSAEHNAVLTLVAPALLPHNILTIDRITNSSLHTKFEAKRKELRLLKTRDSNLLRDCGLNSDEIATRIQSDIAWDDAHHNGCQPPFPPFDENAALLFHCSKSDPSLILSQGLDNRMAHGGLLGQGIYFADNPKKSIQYDQTGNATLFVFQVLLGDCLYVSTAATVQQARREPAKVDAQKRNKHDLFFDSIVARPAGANEYVVYNACQCVPVYAIAYQRGSIAGAVQGADLSAPFPPFMWHDPVHPPAGPSCGYSTWKHDAHHIFSSMAADISDTIPPSSSRQKAILFGDFDDLLITPPIPPATPLVQWKCGECSAMVDDDFFECLSCGSSKPVVLRRLFDQLSGTAPVRIKQHGNTFEILDSDDEKEEIVAKSAVRGVGGKGKAVMVDLDEPELNPVPRKRRKVGGCAVAAGGGAAAAGGISSSNAVICIDSDDEVEV
ncbi:hypothetical protein HDU98_011054, partial [Podochytrium sp. JEL0797]